ncbi:hypothetical protein ACWD0Y_26430, partial [Streptomyces altiplanensis]
MGNSQGSHRAVRGSGRRTAEYGAPPAPSYGLREVRLPRQFPGAAATPAAPAAPAPPVTPGVPGGGSGRADARRAAKPERAASRIQQIESQAFDVVVTVARHALPAEIEAGAGIETVATSENV